MSECLIVVFNELPELLISKVCPEGTFFLDQVAFRNMGYGDMTGFYDWLRTNEGRVIGVAYQPLVDTGGDELISRIARLDYARNSPGRNGVEVFFGREREFCEDKSADQDFFENRVYLSDDNVLAVSFDTRFAQPSLDRSFVANLRRID